MIAVKKEQRGWIDVATARDLSSDLCVAAGPVAVELSLAGTVNLLQKVNAARQRHRCVCLPISRLSQRYSCLPGHPEEQPTHVWLESFGEFKASQDALLRVCLLLCVTAGGGGAVTLAMQLHILQRLPQRKNVFLQHAITTDYRLPSLHQKLLPEKEKHCAFVCVVTHK